MISSSILKEFLNSNVCADNQLILDSFYSLPDKNWVSGVFAEAFRSNLSEEGIIAYSPESNDCDKFSRYAWALASLANADTQKGSGLAFGMLTYKRDSDQKGHCINFAVCRDSDHELELIFFEPQSQSLVQLSVAEMANCGAYIV